MLNNFPRTLLDKFLHHQLVHTAEVRELVSCYIPNLASHLPPVVEPLRLLIVPWAYK